MSPTARSLALLRKTYPLVQVVEKWIPQARRRVDLFGIGDIVAVSDTEVVLVQATSASNVSARVHKITDSPALDVLRKAGIRIVVHGWSKSREGRWGCRIVDLS